MTFEEFPEDVRRDVDRLARLGERHPDPQVAKIARHWAHETLSRTGTAGAYWTVALDFVISVLLGGGGAGTSGSLLFKRRLARRLAKIDPG